MQPPAALQVLLYESKLYSVARQIENEHAQLTIKFRDLTSIHSHSALLACTVLRSGANSRGPHSSKGRSPRRLRVRLPGAPGMANSAPRRSLDESGGHTEEAITNEPPSIPAEQIIQKFSQHESEFRKERDNYTYTQTFVIANARSRRLSRRRISPHQRYSSSRRTASATNTSPMLRVRRSPRLQFTKQDLDDLQNIQPFVLTTEELPKYNVTYVGRQIIDELHTYVFDVAPKKMEKDQRYFQGRVWVDDKDMQIVKSYGKAVPDIIKKNNENIFPHFETYRENITGPYWFPDLHARRRHLAFQHRRRAHSLDREVRQLQAFRLQPQNRHARRRSNSSAESLRLYSLGDSPANCRRVPSLRYSLLAASGYVG